MWPAVISSCIHVVAVQRMIPHLAFTVQSIYQMASVKSDQVQIDNACLRAFRSTALVEHREHSAKHTKSSPRRHQAAIRCKDSWILGFLDFLGGYGLAYDTLCVGNHVFALREKCMRSPTAALVSPIAHSRPLSDPPNLCYTVVHQS